MNGSASDYLLSPRLNKGTAFTLQERAELGLEGLLPDAVTDVDMQMDRLRAQMSRIATPLEKYIYLSELQDRNERLFFSLLASQIPELMPIVYTPTVGEACQRFDGIFRRPKGLYLSLRHRGHLRKLLENWPHSDVRIIVVTDGERILGLGDLGAGGMGIPVGKLALYTACAGVSPALCLPIVLDVGTNNETLLADPLYLGLRRIRISGAEYLEFVDEFVDAVQEVFPTCCIQFEDFSKRNAVPLLERYRDRCCCFNDDVQGTAAVALAGLLGATQVIGGGFEQHKFLFLGAGSAGTGIADLICARLRREGFSETEARERCWLVNSRGLVTHETTGLESFQSRYAHQHAPVLTLLEAIQQLRPTALIGVAAVPGAFDRPVIEAMAAMNQRPIIFPLANPVSKSECTPQQAIDWSEGRAIVSSGSPFPPITYSGKTWTASQGNNVYIFPAVGLAVLATNPERIPDEAFLCAAEALAAQVSAQDFSNNAVYPPIGRIRASSIEVAIAVAQFFFDQSLARVPRPTDLRSFILQHVWNPAYSATR